MLAVSLKRRRRPTSPPDDLGGYLVPKKISATLLRIFARHALAKAVLDAQEALAAFDKETDRRERIRDSLKRYHAQRRKAQP